MSGFFRPLPSREGECSSRKDDLRRKSPVGIGRAELWDGSVGGVSPGSSLRNSIALVAGGAVSEPPGTDCAAGLGTASLLCLLLTAVQFGRIVLAAHRHSRSRSANRTHGVFSL